MSQNPVFNKKTFFGAPRQQIAADRMTAEGTVNKAFALLATLLLSALWPWSQTMAGDLAASSAVMLLAYRAGIIRATERFRAIIVGATGAIALSYLIVLVLSLFHVALPIFESAGPLGILVSLVIVAVAAGNLILDFDMIETGVQRGAPRYMEWYAAFGLMVTLVWLCLEIIRLLAKARRN